MEPSLEGLDLALNCELDAPPGKVRAEIEGALTRLGPGPGETRGGGNRGVGERVGDGSSGTNSGNGCVDSTLKKPPAQAPTRQTPRAQVGNAVLASAPGHPIWPLIIREVRFGVHRTHWKALQSV
jgi:hypothetical protein